MLSSAVRNDQVSQPPYGLSISCIPCAVVSIALSAIITLAGVLLYFGILTGLNGYAALHIPEFLMGAGGFAFLVFVVDSCRCARAASQNQVQSLKQHRVEPQNKQLTSGTNTTESLTMMANSISSSSKALLNAATGTAMFSASVNEPTTQSAMTTESEQASAATLSAAVAAVVTTTTIVQPTLPQEALESLAPVESPYANFSNLSWDSDANAIHSNCQRLMTEARSFFNKPTMNIYYNSPKPQVVVQIGKSIIATVSFSAKNGKTEGLSDRAIAEAISQNSLITPPRRN